MEETVLRVLIGGTVVSSFALLGDVRVLKPHLPLVMLTGDAHLPDSARECVDAVITKGLSSPRELFDTIERLLPDAKLRPHRPC